MKKKKTQQDKSLATVHRTLKRPKIVNQVIRSKMLNPLNLETPMASTTAASKL